MAEFKIKIAGHVALVSSLFDSTKDYCRAYLTEEPEDFCVEVSREDLAFEQAWLDEEAKQEGLRRRVFSEPFLERAAIQRKVAEFLSCHNTILLHGSTVAVDGEAFLFTAGCGTGKSTHTRLYREVFGPRAVMVNDDKPFLKLTESAVFACGAPWSGKHGLDTNITVPLKGICILERGTENRIRRISAAETLDMLKHQSCPPEDESRLTGYYALVERLAETVPLWRMECSKEPQAALVSYRAMSGKEA